MCPSPYRSGGLSCSWRQVLLRGRWTNNTAGHQCSRNARRLLRRVANKPPTVGRNKAKEALAISVANLPNIAADLKRIYYATAVNATIFLMGCNAGADARGTELLEALATVWPQRKIVAFRERGPSGRSESIASTKKCTEPGMRDTQHPFPSQPGAAEPKFAQFWRNLKKMPWASETSGGAIWIENGKIEKNVMEPPFNF